MLTILLFINRFQVRKLVVYSFRRTANDRVGSHQWVAKLAVATSDAPPLLTVRTAISRVLRGDSSGLTTSSRVLPATEDGLLCPFVISFVFLTRQALRLLVTRQTMQTIRCGHSKHTVGLPANRASRPQYGRLHIRKFVMIWPK